MARSLQAAQGHPGGEAGWWLVVSLEAGLPLPRTHVPSTPIWSAWAESLSLLCKKQKQLVSILENPRDWAACLLSLLATAIGAGAAKMAAVLPRG